MRTISRSSRFKSDFKKILRSGRSRDFLITFDEVVRRLIESKDLPAAVYDHALIGNWIGYRECHLKPDLLLVYRHDSADNITLVRMGTHNDVFN